MPRPDRLYLPSLQFLPFTKQNRRVRIFRHALAIDERRRMFRHYRWNEDQKFAATRFGGQDVDQDSKQVWFAGVHADVGGGYPEAESGLSKFPLQWMLAEAEQHGLRLNQSLRRHLVEGSGDSGSLNSYVPPDAKGQLHKSLTGVWWLLEFLPKRAKWRRWPKRWTFAGLYIPRAEPRFIPTGSLIHQSVLERVDTVPGYRPVNLPEAYGLEGGTGPGTD